ncbi:MAG: phage terminase large subunit [Gammaproteobacteria bacterium]|nr:phage terminase large subunit [Gammaproteobacteria bacterium]
MPITPADLKTLLANPDAALEALNYFEAENSLLGFIKLTWPILEPGRKFISGWHIEAVCEHLEAVTRGEIKRLLINVPPGCMKSLTTDVFWPAWEWGPKRMPSLRYVSASYSENLTIRDNRRCRNLIVSEIYQKYWGDVFQLDSAQNSKTRYDTDKTGFKIATSTGGLATGERGDRFITDDPHNIADGESEAKRNATLLWYTETVPTRINDPVESAFVTIMQRVHSGDVSGEILARELGYEHLMIPMEFEPERRCYVTIPHPYMGKDIEPVDVVFNDTTNSWTPVKDFNEADITEDSKFEKRYNADPRTELGELMWKDRMPKEVIDRDRHVLGEYAYAGQYQQRPAPRGGGLFKKEDFEIIDIAPVGGQFVRGWDLAATKSLTAAYTAGVKMQLAPDGTIIIHNVTRFRDEPEKVEKKVKNIAGQDGINVTQDIPQDPGAAGKTTKRAFTVALQGFDVRFSPETGDKETRAVPLSAQAEAGNVKLLRGKWNKDFLEEASTFPRGLYKDQIDGASRAYSSLIRKRKRPIGGAPQTVSGGN